jgi:hypothetical protein
MKSNEACGKPDAPTNKFKSISRVWKPPGAPSPHGNPRRSRSCSRTGASLRPQAQKATEEIQGRQHGLGVDGTSRPTRQHLQIKCPATSLRTQPMRLLGPPAPPPGDARPRPASKATAGSRFRLTFGFADAVPAGSASASPTTRPSSRCSRSALGSIGLGARGTPACVS